MKGISNEDILEEIVGEGGYHLEMKGISNVTSAEEILKAVVIILK